MVNIQTQADQIHFIVKGIHKFFAFKNKITVSKKNLVNVKFDPEAVKGVWKGIRVLGTCVPGVIRAGTYSQAKKLYFWDVVRPQKTIIVELTNSTYEKLIIEVADPIEARAQIEQYIQESR